MQAALSDAAAAGASRAEAARTIALQAGAAAARGLRPLAALTALDARATLRAAHGARDGKPPTVSEQILVCVAWPYANGPIHHGQLGGAYLPADIFTRYQRIRGARVAMVSGSDTHGTPITVRADEEGRRPQDVVAEFHQSILDTWAGIGISFDTFTTTMTDNHPQGDARAVPPPAGERPPLHRNARALLRRRGRSATCRTAMSRGRARTAAIRARAAISATPAGASSTPPTLIDPRSRASGAAPQLRSSEHYFPAPDRLRSGAHGMARRRQGSTGARTCSTLPAGCCARGCRIARLRAISRGACRYRSRAGQDKRIYVWFEAVIGYLSATVEWAAAHGEPEAWRDFWQSPEARIYNFIGKGQHPLPHRDLARHSARRGRLQPALRCARQSVHHDVRQQGQHEPALGCLGQRLSDPLRP